MFFKGSRYEDVESTTVTDVTGRELEYKRIRHIPPTEARFGYAVADGERLDHVAHRFYKDPERFWRICDANLATWPPELMTPPGRTIGIPAAQG